MKSRKIFRTVTYLVLTIAMLISGICIADVLPIEGSKEVQAATGLTESKDGNYSYKIYSAGMEEGIPEEEGYLFAGWYKSADCTTKENALTKAETPGEGHYAKFVKADALSVLAQGTLGRVTSTNVYAYEGKYVLRFVSSVDSEDYQNVGFKVSYTTEDGVTKTGTYRTKNVFSRIYSTTGTSQDGQLDTYSHSPKVVSTKSEFFITAKLALDETGERSIATDFKVQAFWDTFDGKRVFGEERYISYNDSQNDQVLTMNVSNVLEEAEYNFTIDGTAVDGVSVKKLDANNVKITLPSGRTRSGMKSVSAIKLKQTTASGDSVEDETLYRNLSSGYNPQETYKIDTSWYDHHSTEKEFVIASNADLYGFAQVIAENRDAFAGNIVYLVSDIALNDGLASIFKAGITETDTVVNTWIPIGKTTSDTKATPFNGIFDGQMCSISGIYCSRTTVCAGLFNVLNQSGEIKKLKLENSYFYSQAGYAAAVVGQAATTSDIDTVYVGADVIVESDSGNVGGIVALDQGSTIQKCWNAATVTLTNTTNSKLQGIGGIVGRVDANTCNIIDCINTGKVETKITHTVPCIGGIVGGIWSGTLNVTRVLNLTQPVKTASNTTAYSSIVGLNNGATCIIADAYDASGFTSKPYDEIQGDINSCTTEAITGTNAVTYLQNFDFNDTWLAVDGGTPILKSFKEDTATHGWYDISWYNENASEYTLYDKEDLYGFAILSETNEFAEKTIYLGADIVINEEDSATLSKDKKPTYSWNPIGKVRSGGLPTKFKGTFDGKGHTISGIYSNQTTAYNGLFAWIVGGIVKNIKLSNSYFYSSNSIIGSMAGRLQTGRFDSVEVDDTVIVEYEGTTDFVGLEALVGGLVGYSSTAKATLNNCSFAGTINNKSTTMRDTGGIVGYVQGSLTLSNCLVTGHINVSHYTKNTAPRAAGMVGYNVGATLTIKNSVFRGTGACAQGASVKALVGLNSGTLTIEDCYNKENINSQYGDYNGTASGYAETIRETNKDKLDYANLLKTGYWTVGEDKYPILITAKQSPAITPDTSWIPEDAASGTYYISDRADLYGLMELSKTNNFAGVTIRLEKDIVVNSGESSDWVDWAPTYLWTPIGVNGTAQAFAGTFDGQGYTISGLYHNRTDVSVGGLFGTLAANGCIQNLKVANSYLFANGTIGAVLGENKGGNLSSIYVGSDVTVSSSGEKTGGIIGVSNGNVSLTKCWNAANVTSTTRYVGGLIGYVDGSGACLTITDCLNTGTIHSTHWGSNMGGLLGRVVGAVADNGVQMLRCLNSGTISAPSDTNNLFGSIVGYPQAVNKVVFTDVYATDGTGRFTDDYSHYAQAGTENNITDATTVYGALAKDVMTNFDFINTWVIVENGTPVLDIEEKDASTMLWNILANAKTENQTLNATSGEKVTISIEGESKYTPQGGWTGDNGHHYQAFIDRNNTTDDSDNRVCIAEFDNTGNLVSQTALDLALHHANDITYNSKEKCLLVCHGNTLSKIDIDNLQGGVTETVTLSEAVYSIDYNETNDCYVVGCSGGLEFQVLDANFTEISGRRYDTSKHTQIVCETESCSNKGYVYQGMACDDRYVYFITYRQCTGGHDLSEHNQIAVYDWSGEFVTWIALEHPDYEPENISIVDGNIYYTVWPQGFSRDEAYVYKVQTLK